jgi:hypothetical protein
MTDYSFLQKNFTDMNKNALTSFMAYLQELRSKEVDKIVFVEGVDDLKLYNDIYSLKYIFIFYIFGAIKRFEIVHV